MKLSLPKPGRQYHSWDGRRSVVWVGKEFFTLNYVAIPAAIVGVHVSNFFNYIIYRNLIKV